MNRRSRQHTPVVPFDSLPADERALVGGLSARLSGWKSRDFAKELEAAAARRREALVASAELTDPPTFENTCLPLEMLDLEADTVSTDFNSLLSALRPARLVVAEKKIVAILSRMESEDMSDNRLALRLRRLRRSAPELYPAQKKLLDDHYKGFLRSGYYLPPSRRRALSLLFTRLAKLESAYSRASAAERKYVMVRSARQLDGLSATEIAEFRGHARKMGRQGWAVPLEPTQHQPLTASLKSAALRRRLHEISMRRGRRTARIAGEILSLRRRAAALLSFRDWASCKLSESFAKSPSRVWSSLKSIARTALPLAARDLATARSRGWSKSEDTPLCPLSFLPSEEDSFRGFDPVIVLEKGCFTAAHRLFGLSFQRVTGVALYHPDAMLYRVLEKSGDTLGFLTVDPWIRRGKEDGAWASQWMTLPGSLPAAAIFTNAPRSGCPFSEVKTMFHEFGHALHALFSFGQFPSHWGLEMPSDFAEIPSQLAETWAENPEIYREFAPSDAPPLEALCPKAPAAGAGLRQAALLVSSASDMLLHSSPAPPPIDSSDRRAAAALGLPRALSTPRYKAGYFEHAFSAGYDAAYYSYLWTESKAKSLARKVHKLGGLSESAGSLLREQLLAPGGRVSSATLRARPGRQG